MTQHMPFRITCTFGETFDFPDGFSVASLIDYEVASFGGEITMTYLLSAEEDEEYELSDAELRKVAAFMVELQGDDGPSFFSDPEPADKVEIATSDDLKRFFTVVG